MTPGSAATPATQVSSCATLLLSSPSPTSLSTGADVGAAAFSGCQRAHRAVFLATDVLAHILQFGSLSELLISRLVCASFNACCVGSPAYSLDRRLLTRASLRKFGVTYADGDDAHWNLEYDMRSFGLDTVVHSELPARCKLGFLRGQDMTMVHYAAMYNDVDQIKSIMRLGTDVNKNSIDGDGYGLNSLNWKPLHIAAYLGIWNASTGFVSLFMSGCVRL
jgi:hypothetical protein